MSYTDNWKDCRNHFMKKHVIITILYSLSLLIIASTVGFIVTRQNVTQKTQLVPPVHQTPVRNKASTQSNIPKVDHVEVIESSATPVGWDDHESYDKAMTVSAPANIKVQSTANIDTNGNAKNYGFVIGDQSDPNSGYCGLGSSDDSFVQLTESYERTNSGDDGKIDPTANRSWHNIYEKDEFTFNGVKAVRYASTDRNADSDKKTEDVKYFVDGVKNRYIFTCVLKDAITKDVVDTMFKTISFK